MNTHRSLTEVVGSLKNGLIIQGFVNATSACCNCNIENLMRILIRKMWAIFTWYPNFKPGSQILTDSIYFLPGNHVFTW